jgi:hypothetical protein
VLRFEQELTGPGNYLNRDSSPKNGRCANDDLGSVPARKNSEATRE